LYAPENPSLPKPWRGLIDSITGYLYYWNSYTNVTRYERPTAAPLPLVGPWTPDQAYFDNLFAKLNAINMALSSSTPAPAAWPSSSDPAPTSSWAAMPTSCVAPSRPSSSLVAWLTTLGATIPGPVYQPLAATLAAATMSTTVAPPPSSRGHNSRSCASSALVRSQQWQLLLPRLSCPHHRHHPRHQGQPSPLPLTPRAMSRRGCLLRDIQRRPSTCRLQHTVS
jgi:hypothetical protein